MKHNLYRDTLHGIQAQAGDKMSAWQLIRSKCHELAIAVPLYTQIEIVKSNVPTKYTNR